MPKRLRALAPPVPWQWQLREQFTAYLPLLLMLLLALVTWWLVKNAPQAVQERPAAALRHEPDYTMNAFTVQRFAPDGRLRARIEGAEARHYPDNDVLEVDDVRIRAFGEDGSVMVATATRGLVNGDGSEVQLLGSVRVDHRPAEGEPMRLSSEFVHAFLVTERLRSHLPVTITQGGSELRGAGFEYDHLRRNLQLNGRVRGVFHPPSRRGG